MNRKVPAQVLAVECWIGRSGVRAAAEEYKKGNYTYIIATGPTIGRGWEVEGSNVAELAEQELLQQGIPGKEIIVARARKTNRNRTYESAVSSRSELGNRNLTPSAITVFTLGLHARRSRLVFSEVFGRDTEIGVISWSPPNYEDSHWTSSTERIEAMVIETLSYLLRRFTNLF